MGESKMPARTPGPWSVGDTGRMVVREVPGMCDGGDYYSVAVTTAHSLLPESEALANAAFIVEACNQYDALKHRADLVEQMAAALRESKLQLEYLDAKFARTGTTPTAVVRIDAALQAYEAAQ